MRSIRGRDIGLILQSPMSSLNPALKIGTQMYETVRMTRGRSGGQMSIRYVYDQVEGKRAKAAQAR